MKINTGGQAVRVFKTALSVSGSFDEKPKFCPRQMKRRALERRKEAELYRLAKAAGMVV